MVDEAGKTMFRSRVRHFECANLREDHGNSAILSPEAAIILVRNKNNFEPANC